MHAGQEIGRRLIGDERVVDARHFRPAPDQPEIAQLAGRKRPKRFQVVRVAARDDHRVGMGRDRRPRDPRRDVVDHDLDGVREALAVRKLLTIVDHVHAETDVVRQPGEMKPDVSGADHVQLGRRLDRFDVHVHLTAADETGLLGEIVRQLVVDESGFAIGDRFARLPEGVVLVTPAADRSDHPAIRKDEHLRADPLRCRPGCGNDRDESGGLTSIERVGDGREHFAIHVLG